MISSFIRNGVRLTGWLLITAFALALTAWAFIEHYLNASNALELAGTEMKPMTQDSLLGPLFSAFLPDATLPQAMALTISMAETLAFFMISQQLFGVLGLVRVWRVSRKAGDDEQTEEATWQLLRTALELGVLGCLLVWGIRWDLAIFRYRSMAGANGLDDAVQAAATLPSWDLQLQESGGWAVVELTRVGAWGYLAFTAAGCVLLDLCLPRLDDGFTRFMKPIDNAVESWRAGRSEEEQTEVFYGYDQAGQPVYDPKVTIAYNTEGQPVGGEQPIIDPAKPIDYDTKGQPVEKKKQPVDKSGPVEPDVPIFPPVKPFIGDPLPPVQPPHGPATPGVGPGKKEHADLREVRGGVPGDLISLEGAVANPASYHVNLATGEVWDRKGWENLHAVDSEMEREGR